ncbi:MAG TPA: hypothetical protein VFD92_25055 [Candidatus Binatia bacterium]|nr:hypothetical protein [Candidatus Binatia bacterium]
MSSSAAEAGFAAFLARSLDVLARERRDAYLALCRTLAPRSVALVVDGDPVWLEFRQDGVRLHPVRRRAEAELETSEAGILAVIDGAATLAALAIDDRLELRGAVDDVLAFNDALSLYVHGAVRSPSFPRLLRDYRSAVAARAHRARAVGAPASNIRGGRP